LISGGTVLLHGEAPLCATYLAAAGLGRLLVTGEPPDLAARDPAFRLERAPVAAGADVVCDLADGAAYRAATGPAIWGAAVGSRVLLGVEPRGLPGLQSEGAARAVLETLAAGEALRLLLGEEAHPFDFEL
ncbi:MAG: hypothetical protein ACYSX0_13805, partial [Planctomycetota bacterium]